jgi:hypothetical protein
VDIVSISRLLVRPRTFVVLSIGTIRGASGRSRPSDIGARK